MKTIKVDKVILYYMDRVDPDGNLYRFYMYKGMASEIEYFCTKEAGNMTIPIGEGKYVKIVPKEIERIPVRGYRKLAGIWNCETCNGKGWYRLFNYFKYKPTLCYFKKAGHDENGNTRYEISLFNATMSIMPNTFGDSIKPQNNVGRQTNQKLSCWMKKGMILQNRSMMSFMLTSNIIVPALRIKSSGNISKHIKLCRGICLNK